MEISIDELQTKTNANKVLTKPPKKTALIIPKNPPLFEFELFKKDLLTKNKKYFLFFEDKCMFFQDKTLTTLKGVCFYDFDLRVEILYHSPKGQQRKLCDLAYGFKFQRKNDSMQIHSEDKEIYNTLIPYFSRRINLANFHAHFKAIKKIGKGNFASVYLVESTQTQESFAVKAFSKELVFEEEKGKKSLINEIRIMRELNHSNIIKLIEVHETENSIYMVLELLQGGNLVDYLKQHGKFNEKEAATFMRAILRGISHMHSKNIMHRDLKPENILFRNNEITENNICIVDFGLSTFCDVDEYLFVRCGTPGFVAPEVINLKDLTKKYDKICDIFSVGVIFHVLLFGRSIFPGKTYNDILAQNRACNFNFTDPMYKKISNLAKDFLMKLLEVLPEKRISAEAALKHPFLSVAKPLDKNMETIDDFYNIDAEEGHASKLNFSSSHDNKDIFSSTTTSPPEEIFSPLRKYDNLTISPKIIKNSIKDSIKESKDSLELVTRHPILNGYTNTVGDLGSRNFEMSNVLLKKNMAEMEIQSPQLKKALQEHREIKSFQLKLSSFSIKDPVKEEKKTNEVMENLKNFQ